MTTTPSDPRLPDPDTLIFDFEPFVFGGFQAQDFTENLFLVFTQTTKFGLTFQADRARFWASWFSSTTMRLRQFIDTLVLSGLQTASSERETPAAELLLGILGQRLAPIKPLLDQTIYDFEQTRVNQAAEADIDQAAEHYLGILGETLAEVKDVMRQEYDYSLWWRQIVIQETPEDYDLTHRLQAAQATLPSPTRPGRPLPQPALFGVQPAVTTPDRAADPAPWNPLVARRRLANTTAAKAAPVIPLTPERGDLEREG